MNDLSPYSHQSVMTNEVLHYLNPRDGEIYCDATLGGGGHTEAILRAIDFRCKVIGIDRDPSAIQAVSQRLSIAKDHFLAVQGQFGNVQELLLTLGISKINGLIADIGVSSPQFDRAARGFSFQNSGPIDMRMNQDEGYSALDLLHILNEEELANVIFRYGEERYSRRIARTIKEALFQGHLTDTTKLAQVIAKAVPTKELYQDKATRTFQALRIAVNDELRQLDLLLKAAATILTDGGRLVIVSFHSLEDRIVKQSFHHLAKEESTNPLGPSERFQILTKKPILPSAEEIATNPRSRSARLRAAKKLISEGDRT